MKIVDEAAGDFDIVADMLREQVAQWVREAVQLGGGNASEIGRKMQKYGLGLDANAMSGLMNGKRHLRVTEMFAIAEITGAPPPAAASALNRDMPSPEFLAEFLALICQEAGFSQDEAARLAETVLKVARKIEDRKGSDNYARSLRDQAETLALMLFPARKPTKPSGS